MTATLHHCNVLLQPRRQRSFDQIRAAAPMTDLPRFTADSETNACVNDVRPSLEVDAEYIRIVGDIYTNCRITQSVVWSDTNAATLLLTDCK